jgi:hypothetical protein
MASYSFSITNPDQLDLERITLENAGAMAIFVGTSGANGIVMVRDSFARNFDLRDNVLLLGYPLEEEWGYKSFYLSVEDRVLAWDPADWGKAPGIRVDLPKGWQALMTDDPSELQHAKEELATAVKSYHKMRVEVETL